MAKYGDPCGDLPMKAPHFNKEELRKMYKDRVKFNKEVLKLDPSKAREWARSWIRLIQKPF
ncbi:MAG: hypothetical protein WC609_01000 [Candidatus Paceibacterota bacterium]